MVFWITYPLLNLTYSLYPFKRFISYEFNKEKINLEKEYRCEEIRSSSSFKILSEITSFLKTYFGQPPLKPILDIPPNLLLELSDVLFLIRHYNTKEILGTIRYRFIGNYISSENEKIYLVDCFCIHPHWRQKGFGDYLLTHLHHYANQHHIPNALFLKEGSILSIIHLPLYTSTYVYRSLDYYYHSEHIYSLTIKQAHKMVEYYYKIYPNTFIILNKNSKNQIWKIYKKDYHMIIVCFQDTYQRIEEDKKYKKIGWITVWLETSLITPIIRDQASKELSDSVAHLFDYLWINHKWIGSSSLWKVDGSFHWYLYQWATNISITNSYSLMN
jgi:GNAT superfamily N-acetyltransferase